MNTAIETGKLYSTNISTVHWLNISGGTAVGTGLNTRLGFDEKIARKVAEFTSMSKKVFVFLNAITKNVVV